MTRSVKKGPYVDEKLQKKVQATPEGGTVKTWARNSQIHPDFVGYTVAVHNGKNFINVLISEEMVGHRLGEFAPSKLFRKHGGKMQKELEQKKRDAEIAAAKAAKAA